MSASIRSSPSPARPAPEPPRSRGPSSRSSGERTSTPAFVEGDSFHRYDRQEMKDAIAEAEARAATTSAISARKPTCFEELEALFRDVRRERHRPGPQIPAQRSARPSRTARSRAPSPPGQDIPPGHRPAVLRGAARGGRHRRRGRRPDRGPAGRRRADHQPGVDPEDQPGQDRRGYSAEAVMDTILRRMPDYVNYICPQFSRTHINFQRVPTVDTSNPFIARDIPTADESFVIIRFAQPARHRFPLPAVDAARLVHVPAEHHRGPGRQDGPRHAAHLDPARAAADGAPCHLPCPARSGPGRPPGPARPEPS